MSTPLSMEPAKSANSKEKNSNKKLKEIDRTSVSASSGNSKRTMSSRYGMNFFLFMDFFYRPPPLPVTLLVN
jgi:hypothetical protein